MMNSRLSESRQRSILLQCSSVSEKYLSLHLKHTNSVFFKCMYVSGNHETAHTNRQRTCTFPLCTPPSECMIQDGLCERSSPQNIPVEKLCPHPTPKGKDGRIWSKSLVSHPFPVSLWHPSPVCQKLVKTNQLCAVHTIHYLLLEMLSMETARH